jgi:gamma-glutamyltranspeptidase/glutathione hydrolase
LALALEKYGSGRFTLAQILKPAIELARDGFVVADDMADTLSDMYRRMARWPNSAKAFLPQRRHAAAGRRPADPVRSRGNALGDCRQGPRGFYEGPVAERLAKAVRDGGGIMTADDLKSYQAVDPQPGARQLSRLRHRIDAAALLRRHGVAGDAEHPRRGFRCRT